MTMQRDYRDFLEDLISACRSIIGGMTFDACMADERTRFAVTRGYEIMGEATRQLPPEVRDANPDIPWVHMSAVRNRIAHAYFGLDDLLLFETVETGLRRRPGISAARRADRVPSPRHGRPSPGMTERSSVPSADSLIVGRRLRPLLPRLEQLVREHQAEG